MEIAGVDFSGAKTDDRTWVTTGTLEGDVLSLEDCRPVGREGLSQMLLPMPAGPVAPADLDRTPDQRVPASPIGAALDRVARWEAGITLA